MIATTFGIIGSLGLFLYGMKVMSEGLQKVSGEGLRKMLGYMTRNRFYGFLSGFLVTTLVQSSSATTVMLVSFVNAGLLTLRQSIGMIFGANLGTTTTFWLVSILGFKFNLSQIALPCVGVGMAMMFARRPKLHDSGQAILGFGILFLGLDLLKKAVPEVDPNSAFFEFITQYSGMGVQSMLIFFVLGVILTIIVQSSSVAGAITLTLAAKGWIDFESAAAVVLGENVGTTITANIAAMAANSDAKRTARAHFLFNVIGVCWMFFLFHPYLKFVDWITPTAVGDIASIPIHLAVFHSLFNLINAMILMPFVPQIATLAHKMVREKPRPRFGFSDNIRYTAASLPLTGEINLAEAEKEVGRLAELTQAMFRGFNEVYENPETDLQERVTALKAMEEESDKMAFAITQYLIFCASSEISQERANTVVVLLRVVSELEEICDLCYALVKLAEKRSRRQHVLPASTQREVRSFGRLVDEFMEFYQRNLSRRVTPADLEIAMDMENTIDRSRKALRREALNRMTDPDNIKSEILYIDILNNIEKIGNHSLNILQLLCAKD